MQSPRAHSLAAMFLVFGALVLAGCAGVSSRADVRSQVEAVSEERLAAHVDALVAIGPRPSADQAATQRTVEWIVGELRAMGYEPRLEAFDTPLQTMSTRMEKGREITVLRPDGMGEAHNVIAEWPGTEEPERIIEIGAHYDTVMFSPGADDNGSGVAGLLEVARLARAVPCRRTLRFVFGAQEEIGLVGSRRHVELMSDEERANFVALINFEMIGTARHEPGSQVDPSGVPLIGFPDTGDFITVIGDFSTGWLGNAFEDAADTYVPDLRYYSANRIGAWFSDSHRSDHANYWAADLPAIMLSDTAEFRTPHYHERSDLPEHLDFTFMANVTRAALATVLHLAEPIDSESGDSEPGDPESGAASE